MNHSARLLIAATLIFAAGCARQDWIDRTLVTVDVTGTWYGKVAGVGGGFLIGDIFLDLAQQGSTVKGTLRVRAGSAPTLEPIEGTVAGDVFRFRSTRGSLQGELTLSGDEMSGTASTPGGPRAISLQRAESSPPAGSPPR